MIEFGPIGRYGDFPESFKEIVPTDILDVEPWPIRCKTTGNPCGTDTWGNGWTCPCDNCNRWLAGHTMSIPKERGR